MAAVHVEEKSCLVVLSKDSLTPTMLVGVDAAEVLSRALLAAADWVDGYMQESGRLVVPKAELAEVWEVRVGYFDGGVALSFNLPGTRVPLPPDVARALAGRLDAAIAAARSGVSIKIDGREPKKTFGPRPVVA